MAGKSTVHQHVRGGDFAGILPLGCGFHPQSSEISISESCQLYVRPRAAAVQSCTFNFPWLAARVARLVAVSTGIRQLATFPKTQRASANSHYLSGFRLSNGRKYSFLLEMLTQSRRLLGDFRGVAIPLARPSALEIAATLQSAANLISLELTAAVCRSRRYDDSG